VRKLEVGMRVKVKAPMFCAPRSQVWIIKRLDYGGVGLRREGDDTSLDEWPPLAICCDNEVRVLRKQ
jgi:hypothetical protein